MVKKFVLDERSQKVINMLYAYVFIGNRKNDNNNDLNGIENETKCINGSIGEHDDDSDIPDLFIKHKTNMK